MNKLIKAPVIPGYEPCSEEEYNRNRDTIWLEYDNENIVFYISF